jgi:hypothetical protein
MIYLVASAVIAGLFAFIGYELHGMAFVTQYSYLILGVVVAGAMVAGCQMNPANMCRFVRRLHVPFVCRNC